MAKNTYTNSKDSICIFSYNSQGFSEDKQNICNLLMLNSNNHYPILCNQENYNVFRTHGFSTKKLSKIHWKGDRRMECLLPSLTISQKMY